MIFRRLLTLTEQKKVVKFKRPLNLNLGVILFVIIFVYIGIQVYLFLGSEQLSVYEVTENYISDDNTYLGLILRDETVFKNEHAGYINYYVADGKKVSIGTTIYTLDESGDTYNLLSNTEQGTSLNSSDIASIRKSIASYQASYNDSNYNTVYNYKYDIDSTVLEVTNVNMLNTLHELLSKSDSKKNFSVVKATSSGIISYYTDGYEDVTLDTLEDSMFDSTKYVKEQLRTTEMKESNAPAYKLIKSEKWSIVTPLSDEQYKKLSEKKTVHITFLSDKMETNATITFLDKNNKKYAVLHMMGYLSKYINDRYVNIEMGSNNATGYKIPVSSICEKDFYKIPNDYITKGGNDNSYGIVKLSYSKNGDASTEFIETDLYFKDDKYSFIDTSVVNKGDVILLPGSSGTDNTFKVSETGSLTGVFNVNKGYPVFRRIEVLYENNEYCLVDMDTTMGLNNFDHIIVNVDLAKKQNYVKY